MKKFQKIKNIFVFIAILILFVNNKVNASSLTLVPSSIALNTEEQFYVDVMLDTEGATINGVEGSIIFPQEFLSFVRAEEGKSIVSLWVEKPSTDENGVHFSGIIPNGFNGIIDPFNQNKKLQGLIVRLVFQAKKYGDAKISSSQFYTTLNDGRGTINNIDSSSVKLFIQNILKSSIYETKSDRTPELTAYVTHDPNLFENKYVLIFDAKDTQTGIKEVLIKEGRRDWKTITSPYLLEDQTRHSIISVQAVNYSGASISMSIASLPYKLFSYRNIYFTLVSIFAILILLYSVKKIYEKYKNIHN